MVEEAYYNEIDPYAAQWLRNSIDSGLLPKGFVDERDIRDVSPSFISGFGQCHFFAGIGVFPLALKVEGWRADREIWTGSCPCQPFSTAGTKKGFADERHLWPAWFHYIQIANPSVVLGEQVASLDGLAWLDLVQTDLESSGYATTSNDLCAAGFGAPTKRQRLFWSATKEGLGDSNYERLEGQWCLGKLDDQKGWESSRLYRSEANLLPRESEWDWLPDGEGFYRPVEPGTCPVFDGVTKGNGRIRAYGNAIDFRAARAFVRAYMAASDQLAGLDLEAESLV